MNHHRLPFAVGVMAWVSQAACSLAVSESSAAGAAPGLSNPSTQLRVNIVIVIADDMGYGDLGITGHPFIRTPNIDRIGNEGAVFSHYYAPMSICSPSRASMLTGRTPYRLGIYSFIPDDNDFGYLHLDSSEITFPQLLQNVGYQTALIGKWHISHPDWYEQEDQPRLDQYGFDYWFSSKNNTVILNKPKWIRNNVPLGIINGYAANVVGDEAVDWLDNHRDPSRPFLLFVNFYEPHWKVDGPSALVTSYQTNYVSDIQRAHYPASIENVDGEVGRVLDKLDQYNLTTNTIVLFTSDHGPAKFDTGRAYNRNDGRSAPYRGTKYGLWEGSVHVPGLLRWPQEVTPGTVITEPVGSIDWLQTFCSIAGAEIPTDRALDGADFSPLLLGGAFTRTTHLQWHHYNSRLHDSTCPQSALRDGDYVLVGVSENPAPSSSGRWALSHMDTIWNADLVSFELFNIVNDPLQATNLWASHTPYAESLRDALTNYNHQARSAAPGWGHGRSRTNTWNGADAANDSED